MPWFASFYLPLRRCVIFSGGSSGVAPPSSSSLAVQAEVPEQDPTFMAVIVINADESVTEKIESFLENRENFPSWLRGHTCMGCVLSGQGTVLSPIVETQEIMSLYKGPCNLVRLSGSYFIPKDGPVQRYPFGGLMMIGASPNGKIFGGRVSGKLLAETPIQVMLLVAINEDPEWIRLFGTN